MFGTSRGQKPATNTRWVFLALALTTWGARTHGNDIRWRSDDSSSVPTLQASLQEKLGRLAVRANQTHLVVHFDGPVSSEIRAELQEHGLTLLSFRRRTGIDHGVCFPDPPELRPNR